MSRHTLAAHPDKPWVSDVVIGWDRPLASYFVQVFSKATGEDELAIWRGTAPGELPTADAAIAVIAPFAVIPHDLAARLRRDCAEQPVRAPNHPMVGLRARVRREGQPEMEGRIVQSHFAGFFVLLDTPPAGSMGTIVVFHDDIEILGP